MVLYLKHFFKFWLFFELSKNEKVKIFKIAPKELKFLHIVKIDLVHLFLKFQLILTIFKNFKIFEFVNICSYYFIKLLVFMLKSQNFNEYLNNIDFYLWLKNFENWFSQMWFIDSFTSLFCYFCHNVFWAMSFKNCSNSLKFVHAVWFYEIQT